MDFDEALARTVNLLERQGFATYRTLKRRFHLDDATLAALKTALVDTQHLAADEAGTRLVWLGGTAPRLWPHPPGGRRRPGCCRAPPCARAPRLDAPGRARGGSRPAADALDASVRRAWCR